MVGMGDQELVDEVAFRTHDFHAVVTRLLRQAGAIDEVADLLLDALLVQLARREGVDRRLDGARRHQLRAVGVAASVQDLHADLATRFVHRLGDHLVLCGLFGGRKLGRPGTYRAFLVGTDAAGDDQPDPTPCAFGEEGGHALEAVWHFFEAGVHRTHQRTITQCGEPQVQRSQQVWKGAHLRSSSLRRHGSSARLSTV